MSATSGECVRIDRSQWSSPSRPVEKIPSAGSFGRADGLALQDNSSEATALRNPVRGRLIVIGFVAAAPIVVAAWLVLLGWAALALL